MRAARHLRRDSTWNGEHFASEIGRGAGRDQRPAALGGFDDHDPEGQARDRAIPQGEVARVRRRPRRKLRDQRAVGFDLIRERAILWWISPVDARAQHRDRTTAGRQRAAMRGRVDTTRETAHDRRAPRGEVRSRLGDAPASPFVE